MVAESERVQWDCVPLERVGPLRFGMDPQDAVAAMEVRGFTADTTSLPRNFGPFKQQCTRFRRTGTPLYRVDAVAYYVESMGLTCITIDALTGPQVTLDGLRLVGQRPSELAAELAAYLDKLGKEAGITPEGDIGSQELGILPRAQRAGDILLTRVVFGRPNDWANTMFDCIPAEEFDVR
ncbi:hypothetical protein ACFV2U_24460 [Streptomyces sp. NPDC059697]|uniref:hypothetical protein n=1 Tax=Streptomyces sp. NPDC059697 TaxID=3346912 RepID=UPI0036985278